MKTIDKEYEHFNKDQMFSFQSKLSAYKREIETQMEASMNVKVFILTHAYMHAGLCTQSIVSDFIFVAPPIPELYVFFFSSCIILKKLKWLR